ncbi:D-glycero-beta-D-manno-heptose-7-phosphate kinase [Methylocaldum szegediense]|uniref:Bifunctional protein HldE n=1 Tax=Methylocaldum szegediense TaxID=73780 RepID=A0ABM9I6M1_9GAMM|nr:D-glycero-beta-D-manno-heptose-7-phosphate kinase [Methylocaldum szegediense]CAI8926313.1 D-beta-D-heptose 7-phosphate kinase / D-beta-D-heptose 1-phosphate adenylyltransferase [Methylocaldum szegediense]
MTSQRPLIDAVRNAFRTPDGISPRILVVGDLMLDRYLWGEVERISPEAPVPVVHLRHQSDRFGGSANVAANLAGLGVNTFIAGYVGDDAEGQRLMQMLTESSIDSRCLVRSYTRPTVTKTRVIGGHQQMLRLDKEIPGQYVEGERTQLLNAVLDLLSEGPIRAVILSDYAKGALDPGMCQAIIGAARKRNIFVLVDPKGRDYNKYLGANAITPNLRETADVLGVPIHDVDRILDGAKELRRRLGLDFIAVTRSEHGISLIAQEFTKHLPAVAREVFDVSGAGDTVIATLASGITAGLSAVEACQLANAAAATVVSKVGTVPVDREELLHETERENTVSQADKICDMRLLLRRIEAWRARGERIVFTNGCFDLLHAGHVTYLESAKRLGNRLVVGLNTDRSISALKGPSRPVIHEGDRARIIAALESVDAVVLFDEATPIDLIKTVRPDVLVKGSDYTESQVVGAAEVKSWGGRVELIPVVAGRSTSEIIDRVASKTIEAKKVASVTY